MRATIGLAAAAMCGAWLVPARGQVDAATTPQPPAAAEDVPRLIAELDSADPLRREHASDELSTGFGLALKDLERALTDHAGAPLSPEQRHRLLSAARLRFRSEPRAAMGVQFDNTVREAGIRLNATVEGFNAQELLRPGDRIESIAGAKVRDRDHAVAIIVAHDPGDEVEVRLARDGAAMAVRVRLGPRNLLQNAMGLTPESIDDAWAIRSAPYADAVRTPARVIECAVPASGWPGGDETPPPDGAAASAGGEARGAPDPVLLARALDGRVDLTRLPRTRREQLLPNIGPPGRMMDEAKVLRDLSATIENAINVNLGLIRDPSVSPERRSRASREVAAMQIQLAEFRNRIEQLERAQGRPRR